MRNSDKIYFSIFFFLVLASFLNVAVNRARFDRILTTQVMLDEKSVTGNSNNGGKRNPKKSYN